MIETTRQGLAGRATEPPRRARLRDRAATWIARTLIRQVRSMTWPASLRFGARIGDTARAAGLRRGVAERNLDLALPDLSARDRAAISREHYRELGRVAVEYARLGELARAPEGEVMAGIDGMEHLARAQSLGRGVILLTGHFGNFELAAAALARTHPVDFVVKPLSNPDLERWIAAEREAAGVGQVPIGPGMRAAFVALKRERWLALLADQDARRHGVFVPFFGRLASTPVGPAALALRTGAPIVMGFVRRLEDGRHHLTIEPPLEIADQESPDAELRLTALHTARLESWVRRYPAQWFWLHRRWKTSPP